MAQYPYSRANVNYDRLRDELVAAGLPIDYINAGALGTNDFYVFTSRDLTDAEKARLQAILDVHDPRPRRPKNIFSLLRDLKGQTAGVVGLTATQADVVIISLQLGSLSGRWTSLQPPQDGAACVAHWAATSLKGADAADKREAGLRILAMYIQQNPRYLVNPTFDPAVAGLNIPGDEPYDPRPVLKPAPPVTSDSVANQG
jgi:hypothetical protein